ncbi:MAG: 2Fe-2S iron-sulfur cluster-binding protein [Mycobacterium sp.]
MSDEDPGHGAVCAVRFRVDGREVEVDPKEWTLARYLRDELGITAVKFACGEGACGACTILCDGEPVPSCVIPLGLCDGTVVETAGHLARHSAEGRQVAELFTNRAPMQCGFCTPGLLCTMTAALQDRTNGSGAQQRSPAPQKNAAASITAHLCRCTGYVGYLDCLHELLDAASPGGTGKEASRRGQA